MNSYILKNDNKTKDIVLFEEKKSYTFTPKSITKVKKITILDKDMLNGILESKIIKKYNRLLKIVYSILESDDSNEGDILIAFTEISRIKQYLISLINSLDKDILKKYLDKISMLEEELKRYQVIMFNNNLEYIDELGKGR